MKLFNTFVFVCIAVGLAWQLSAPNPMAEAFLTVSLIGLFFVTHR